MKKSKKESIHVPLIVEIDEDGFFIVSCPLFKGCHTYGNTIDEALENIKEVVEMCMDELKTQKKGKKVIPINRFVGFRELEIKAS
jgi:predicted RNase H-like HicB family nuclease